MGATAQATFWLGLLRGTWLGPIKSFHALVSTGYGHFFMTAIVLTVIAVVISARASRKQEGWVWEGDAFRPGAAQKVRRSHLIVMVLLALILGCMVMMRFGGIG
jgi:putative copper export protein